MNSVNDLLTHFNHINASLDSKDLEITNKVKEILMTKEANLSQFSGDNQSKLLTLSVKVGLVKLNGSLINNRTKLMELTFSAKKIAREYSEHHEFYLSKLGEIRAYLKQNPEKINERWVFSATPLHEASCSGLETLTRLFLEFRPDTTLKNEFNQTAEERSAKMGFPFIASLIKNSNKKT